MKLLVDEALLLHSQDESTHMLSIFSKIVDHDIAGQPEDPSKELRVLQLQRLHPGGQATQATTKILLPPALAILCLPVTSDTAFALEVALVENENLFR